MRNRIARAAAPLLAATVVLHPVTATADAQHWHAPLVEPVRVLREFSAPRAPYGPGHRGVDLAAAPGTPVLAAGSGIVRFAGQVAGRGVIVLGHGGVLSTEYEPVVAAVALGSRVSAGATIGVLATTQGHCGPVGCLHWGLRRNGEYSDPMQLLRAARAPVLLPFLGLPVPADRTNPVATPGRVAAAGAMAGGAALAVVAVPGLARRVRPARPAARARPSRASDRRDSR